MEDVLANVTFALGRQTLAGNVKSGRGTGFIVTGIVFKSKVKMELDD